MIKIVVSGCNGHMGRAVTAVAKSDPEVRIVAGFDIEATQMADYPVFAAISDLQNCADPDVSSPDVLIDFSSFSALEWLIEYGISLSVPLVLCTTGYNSEQSAAITEASKLIPIFRSGNLSVGINLLVELVKQTCAVLGEEFDVEIIERHHRRKIDAPSGTALMLADAASEALPYRPDYVFERESSRNPRKPHDISISSVRGGTIVGVHDVIFAGQDEVIELRHTATSRDAFAIGALKAAKFIKDKPPGMYSMKDVLGVAFARKV